MGIATNARRDRCGCPCEWSEGRVCQGNHEGRYVCSGGNGLKTRNRSTSALIGSERGSVGPKGLKPVRQARLECREKRAGGPGAASGSGRHTRTLCRGPRRENAGRDQALRTSDTYRRTFAVGARRQVGGGPGLCNSSPGRSWWSSVQSKWNDRSRCCNELLGSTLAATFGRSPSQGGIGARSARCNVKGGC